MVIKKKLIILLLLYWFITIIFMCLLAQLHTRHFQHLQPASSSRTQPTITISMASPHPSATSSHNCPQTQQTPAASPLIIFDLLMDFAFGHRTACFFPLLTRVPWKSLKAGTWALAWLCWVTKPFSTSSWPRVSVVTKLRVVLLSFFIHVFLAFLIKNRSRSQFEKKTPTSIFTWGCLNIWDLLQNNPLGGCPVKQPCVNGPSAAKKERRKKQQKTEGRHSSYRCS